MQWTVDLRCGYEAGWPLAGVISKLVRPKGVGRPGTPVA